MQRMNKWWHCDYYSDFVPFVSTLGTHIYSARGMASFHLALHLPIWYSIQVRCHGDAKLCSGIYCLHCGRLPLLNMPHRRLKEAAPFAVLHAAGNCMLKRLGHAGIPRFLCSERHTVKHTVHCRRGQVEIEHFKMLKWHSLFYYFFILQVIWIFAFSFYKSVTRTGILAWCYVIILS